MTVEEVYVNSFSKARIAWVEVPVLDGSLYLDDLDTDYVDTSTNLAEEGDWAFPASAGSGTINSVKLRIEACTKVLDCGDILAFVWDGSSWQQVPIVISGTAYAWYESADIKAILDTWAKINGASVYVKYYRVANGLYYLRRLTRKVDYTVAAAGIASRRLLVGVGL